MMYTRFTLWAAAGDAAVASFSPLPSPHQCQSYAATRRIAHLRAATMRHASINLTADTYGKWLPLGNNAAVDRLDAPFFPARGSNVVAGGVLEEAENSEVVGKLVGRVSLRPAD